jgi:putative hydrolase of the HAD superfamily
MQSNPIVLSDADNTLWDTDLVFRKAQLWLLERVEKATGRVAVNDDRLEFVRQFDQAIATKHHAHLRYPPQILVAALAAGLASIPPEAAAEYAIAGRRSALAPPAETTNRLVNLYLADLKERAPLLPTVKDGLKLAKSLGISIHVLTEGTIDRQRELIEHHQIGEYIAGVVQIAKSAEQFLRVRKRYVNNDLIVIGDQEDRDIEPAVSAGCYAILVPGRFKPKWNATGKHSHASFVAANFIEAIGWIERTRRETTARSRPLIKKGLLA